MHLTVQFQVKNKLYRMQLTCIILMKLLKNSNSKDIKKSICVSFTLVVSIKLKMKRNIYIYIDLNDLSIFNCELNFLSLAH